MNTSQFDIKLLTALKHALKDFESDRNRNSIYAGASNRVCGGLAGAIKQELKDFQPELPAPFMVFLTLGTILEHEYWGRGEKVLWSIPIFYKGVPIQLSHRKFGFVVEAENHTSVETRELVLEMLKRLEKGISIAEKILRPVLESQIRSGNLTLPNQFHRLNRMYVFFRKKARRSYSMKPPKPKARKNKDGGAASTEFDFGKPGREGSYYAGAMLDAYFSRLEHQLVLLLGFTDFDPQSDDLVLFTGLNWSDKFKRIIKMNADPQKKVLYDELKHIKERFLNTVSHGLLEKQGLSFYFHVPTLGAIPVRMSRSTGSPIFSFYSISPRTFEEMISLLDKIDSLLENDSDTKYGMQFIKSGLNVSFADDSRNLYKKAMTTDSSFEGLIQYLSRAEADWMNMDF